MDKSKIYEEYEKRELEVLARESTGDYLYRYLEKDDFKKGFLDMLSQLTVVGIVSQEMFEKRFDEMFTQRRGVYKIVVIVHRDSDHIIGTGGVFLEKKFIR